MWATPEFADREEAGRELADALAHLKASRPLVLALPRGGVPIGYEVARSLGAELDVLIVRKIGAPGQPEFGIGAIVDGDESELVLNDYAPSVPGVTAEYIEDEKRRQLGEIERRKRAYRGSRPSPDVTNRTVIVVDDGIASGGTMKVALQALRRRKPAHLVLAVPVAPPESIASLAQLCDETVCHRQPSPFLAVGCHYADFDQTEYDEVIRLLAAAHWAASKKPENVQGGG